MSVGRRANAEHTATCCERLTFSFVSQTIAEGHERELDEADLWECHPDDQPDKLHAEFSAVWDAEKRANAAAPSLFRALFRVCWPRLAALTLINIVGRVSGFAGPLLLQAVLRYLEDPAAPASTGYALAVCMFAVGLLSAIVNSQAMQVQMRGWTRVRAVCSLLVYRKTLRLTAASQAESSSGQVVNLMSSDAEKVGMMMFGLADPVLVPVQLAIYLVLIFQLLGTATWSGFGVMLGAFPVMALIMVGVAVATRDKSALADTRVRLMNEVLQGFRVVRFYAWEPSFLARLTGIRADELAVLRRLSLIRSCVLFIFMLLPSLVSLTAFSVYVSNGNVLSVGTAFTAVAFFNSLRWTLIQLPSSLTNVIIGLVSLKRIQTLLLKAELEDPSAADERCAHSDVPIRIDGGTFAWAVDETAAAASETAVAADGAKETRSDASSAKNLVAASVPSSATATDSSISTTSAVGASASASASEPSASAASPSPASPAILHDIDFGVRRGSLTVVVGAVGCGKTSLALACLGEMIQRAGTRHCAGPVAYVAQTAWIQNMSVRDNILFGRAFDAARYQRVLEACALEHDISILPAQDLTEIGDKGVNLSARATYSDADVFILDDPFSAVDATVGETLFRACLRGMLRAKTVLLVTNQVHLLPDVDMIYVLDHGRIVKRGTFDEIERTGFSFAMLRQQTADAPAAADANHSIAVTAETGESAASVGASSMVLTVNPLATATVSASPAVTDSAAADGTSVATDVTLDFAIAAKPDEAAAPVSVSSASTVSASVSASTAASAISAAATVTAGKKLVQDEDRAKGYVESGVYIEYFRRLGGLVFVFFMAVFMAGGQVAMIAMDVWLSYWAVDAYGRDNTFYITVYGLIGAATAVLMLCRGVTMAFGVVRASSSLHLDMLTSVLRAPSRFFDATPSGRVLNRFSKDVDDVDTFVPMMSENLLTILSGLVGSVIVMAVATPWFVAVLVVVVYFFVRIQRYYSRAAIQLQRFEAVSRSPLYQHFAETLNGVVTIRAFRRTRAFEAANSDLCERNISTFFLTRLVFRWASFRIDSVNALLLLSSSLFIVAAKGTLAPGLAGVALTQILSLGGMLGFTIMMATDLQNRMNAVERVLEYSTKIPQEPPWQVPEVDDALPAGWPTHGRIDFDNVTMCYREALEPALRGASAAVGAREKLGVAGRTGSGKSTLMLCLFRLYPLSAGAIRIDGVDIATVGLHTLRRRLAIIPQDSFMVSGTLRDNLDPFHESTDAELTGALDSANLRAFVEHELQGGLDAVVSEAGANFSQGQRQLICMARALLRKPKILVMDEATSSVDHATDALIQTAVRDKFAASTVLTIAHRLNTIMDADRVCVLEQGRIVELGPPLELIAADAEPAADETAAAEEAAVDAASTSGVGHLLRADGGAASAPIKRGLFRSMHEASQLSHSHGHQRGAAQ